VEPSVADQSHGFWRRVRLIPFLRTFEGSSVDLTIEAKLRAELPGILAWAVQGAIAWQQRGLDPPAQVQQATQDYRNESDPLAQFLDECCVVGEQFHVGATELFKAYESWGVQQGFKDRERLTATKFGTQVKARFERRHTNAGKRYVGLGLRSERGDPPGVTGGMDIFAAAKEPSEAEVTGSVTGCEADVSENEKPPLENRLTREFVEKAVTTRHPVTSARRACKRCQCELNRVATSNLCDRCRDAAVREIAGTR
jgi:phage/plasmid-associated DNA primase